MFIAALVTIAKMWKTVQVPVVGEWIKKAVVPSHSGKLHGHKEGGTLTFCDTMDGPGDYYANCSKPVRGRQIPYDLTHMWNQMNKIN